MSAEKFAMKAETDAALIARIAVGLVADAQAYDPRLDVQAAALKAAAAVIDHTIAMQGQRALYASMLRPK